MSKERIIKVLKFGGTSVGSVVALKSILNIVKDRVENQKEKVILVCSAMSGTTNQLIQLTTYAIDSESHSCDKVLNTIKQRHIDTINELCLCDLGDVKKASSLQLDKLRHIAMSHLNDRIEELQNIVNNIMHPIPSEDNANTNTSNENPYGDFTKTLDTIVGFGELLSCQMVADLLHCHNLKAEFVDARKLIKTDSNFGNAKVDYEITNKNLATLKNQDAIPVITGYIASDSNSIPTTLGRGGSDYTAAIVGAGIHASKVEIWTDVDGVMTTDPRLVDKAFTIPKLSYHEAVELSHFGARIIYTPTLYPVLQADVPLVVKNTFNPTHPGTLVSHQEYQSEFAICGISAMKDTAMIVIEGSGMANEPGTLSRAANVLANNNINIILITQASSEHSICLIVDNHSKQNAVVTLNKEFASEIESHSIDMVEAREHLSVVSIVGDGMCRNPGVVGTLYSVLGKHGINVVAIAQGASERNISTVVEQSELAKALNVIHDAFFYTNITTLNLFMIGVGLIGRELITQMNNAKNYLRLDKQLDINMIGLANSKTMLINKDGIDLTSWENQLAISNTGSNIKNFIDNMHVLNLPNSVFVDCTGGADVVQAYPSILNNNVSIVTPNKVANSDSYENYKRLRDLTTQHHVKFMYETNVGAGLPVISTLHNLMSSGDDVVVIEGVLSGTLSYIFNNFVNDKKFSEVVREAKQSGYTEPDPRNDLNGLDVARKILILAREVGAKIELSDISIENILPKECVAAKTVDDFFIELEKHDATFETLKNTAKEKKQVMRYIAKYENGRATVNLNMVDHTHPFYGLSGSDNIIAFKTKRYSNNPLVVQGPGAGAEVTASGVFADIVTVSKYLADRL